MPAGFKIVNTNDYVTDGIIIEDVSYEATKGSQFVWIPVGNIKTEDNTIENIKLSRYTFDEDGKETDQSSNVINNYFVEINTSTYGNITAKENIESEDSGFRKSAIENHGYYIGRYEARTKVARTFRNEELKQVTENTNDYVYSFVTEPQAAEKSRGMYENKNFKSDLVNSYAWDTVILFLQKFDNRKGIQSNIMPYSIQTSKNSGNLELKGTNNLKDISKQDRNCNIYDIASNYLEWTTETYKKEENPCVKRGGFTFGKAPYTPSFRYSDITSSSEAYRTFRPILYLK